MPAGHCVSERIERYICQASRCFASLNMTHYILRNLRCVSLKKEKGAGLDARRFATLNMTAYGSSNQWSVTHAHALSQ